MEKVKSRHGGRTPKRLGLKNYSWRPLNTTAAIQHSTTTCGHAPAPVRNVTELDGVAVYICKSCFNYLLRVEFKTIVRRQVAALFGNLWPPGFNPEAAMPAGRGAAYG